MIVENKTPSNKFTTSFAGYSKVGFHGTSSFAASKIETVGFLPDKIFAPGDHDTVLKEALLLSIDTADYEQWLATRSVTFAQLESDALAHIKSGKSGGQGLRTMLDVLQKIALTGCPTQTRMANGFITRIGTVRQSAPVIYAVDLSNVGHRLVPDQHQRLDQIYFDPSAPLPNVSIVTPHEIIAKLDVF